MLARMDEVLSKLAPHLTGVDREASEHEARALLRSLDERLDFELLTERDGARVVVISARAERRLKPLAETLVARAPELGSTRFVAHRPARPLDAALEDVRREYGFDLGDARARAGFSRGHLLDVVIYGKGFGGRKDEAARAAAELAVESLLGERVLDDWIGDIAAEPLRGGGPLRIVDRDSPVTFAISELPAAIAAAVEGLRSGLPDPTHTEIPREGWTLFEMEPVPAHDYATQDDVALASSALPEMLKCFLEGAPFSSVRFMRSAGCFAYLKVDSHEASFEERLARRDQLEAALQRALGERALGAVVGSGLGLRYTYLDLALAPGPEALDVVREAARESAPRRSWIAFCDTDWESEWLGVWPDSPPPPGC